MARLEGPSFRDGIPPWGWAVLVLTRLAPIVLLAGGIWWWTHGGAQQFPRLVRQAAQWVRATADSAFGR